MHVTFEEAQQAVEAAIGRNERSAGVPRAAEVGHVAVSGLEYEQVGTRPLASESKLGSCYRAAGSRRVHGGVPPTHARCSL